MIHDPDGEDDDPMVSHSVGLGVQAGDTIISESLDMEDAGRVDSFVVIKSAWMRLTEHLLDADFGDESQDLIETMRRIQTMLQERQHNA
jgi:hypothetical protein